MLSDGDFLRIGHGREMDRLHKRWEEHDSANRKPDLEASHCRPCPETAGAKVPRQNG